MCYNIESNNLKSVTGYKFVITDTHGHHYSPFTGIRYKVGPVPTVDNKHKYKYRIYGSNSFGVPITSYHSWNYNYTQFKYKLTAVIKTQQEALCKCNKFIDNYYKIIGDRYKFNIIKMTLSGDIYDGLFDSTKVYLGNHIDSISVVKTTKDKDNNKYIKYV